MKGVTTDHVARIVAGIAANLGFYQFMPYDDPNRVASCIGEMFVKIHNMLVDNNEDNEYWSSYKDD